VTAAEEKAAARRALRNKYAALTTQQCNFWGERIFENIISLPEYENAHSVFAYVSTGSEPDTIQLIKHALSDGKTVAVPLSLPGGHMELCVINSLSELVPGRYGIPAPPEGAARLSPEEVSLALIPALAFDENGFRLGRGGGYYDRFLASTGACTVGLAYSDFVRSVPLEEHDMPVSLLVTDRFIITCR